MKSKIIVPLTLLITVGIFLLYNMLSPASEITSPVLPSSSRTSSTSEAPDADNVSTAHLNQVHQLKMFLAEHPEDTTHLLRLARMYHDGHDPASAAVYYERFLELKPDARQVWLDLANCFAETVQWTKALQTTESMLKNYPGDAEGLYNMGAIYANMGNRDKALEIWNQLLEEHYKPDIRQLAGQSIQKINNSGS